MAVTIRVFNNANELASAEIPPGSIDEIQAALGGGTNAETAAAFLEAVKKVMKPYIKALVVREVEDEHDTARYAAVESRKAAFDNNWPDDA